MTATRKSKNNSTRRHSKVKQIEKKKGADLGKWVLDQNTLCDPPVAVHLRDTHTHPPTHWIINRV